MHIFSTNIAELPWIKSELVPDKQIAGSLVSCITSGKGSPKVCLQGEGCPGHNASVTAEENSVCVTRLTDENVWRDILPYLFLSYFTCFYFTVFIFRCT